MAERATCAFCGGQAVRPLNAFGPRCLVGDYRMTDGRVENVYCTVCGLAWNRLMMTDDELGAFYAGYTKKVGVEDEDDLLFGPTDSEVETLTASQVTFLAGHVPAASGRVLDIGCGKGAFLSAFAAARPGWTSVGIEPSSEEAALARRHPAFEIHEGMFGETDLGAASFDLVAIMHVLEHVSDPTSVIDRIHAALKAGGLAFIEVPNVLDLNMFYDLLLFEHLYHFNPATLAWQLEQRGFDVLAADTSSSYGALRIVARKRGDRRATAPPPPAAPMADGFARWTDQWARMNAICRVGAARARSGRRVAIFGAGMTSATWLVYSDLFDAPIIGCVDESPWKVGRPFFGRPVHALGDLASLDLDTILVATMPGSQANVAAKLSRLAPSAIDVLTYVRA